MTEAAVQIGAQTAWQNGAASAPSDDNGLTAVAVCKCGAGINTEHPERCQRGHTRVGFVGPNFQHGGRAAIMPPAHVGLWNAIVERALRGTGYTRKDAPEEALEAAEVLADARLIRRLAFAGIGRQRRAMAHWSVAAGQAMAAVRILSTIRKPPTANPAEAFRAKLLASEDASAGPGESRR